MKLFFMLLLATCWVGIHCEKSAVAECAEQNNIDGNMIDDMKKNQSFSATQDTKAFATCIAKKTGLMSEDGTLSKSFTDAPNVSCNKLEGKDQHELAAAVMECLIKADPANLVDLHL